MYNVDKMGNKVYLSAGEKNLPAWSALSTQRIAPPTQQYHGTFLLSPRINQFCDGVSSVRQVRRAVSAVRCAAGCVGQGDMQRQAVRPEHPRPHDGRPPGQDPHALLRGINNRPHGYLLCRKYYARIIML